jgi:hypothetical protein
MGSTIFSNILSDPKNPLNSCSRTEVDSAPLVESADKKANTDIALRYVSSMQRVFFYFVLVSIDWSSLKDPNGEKNKKKIEKIEIIKNNWKTWDEQFKLE